MKRGKGNIQVISNKLKACFIYQMKERKSGSKYNVDSVNPYKCNFILQYLVKKS